MYCCKPRAASCELDPLNKKALFNASVVSTALSKSPVITAIFCAVPATSSSRVGKPWIPSDNLLIAFSDVLASNPISSITRGKLFSVSYRSIAPSKDCLTISIPLYANATAPKAVANFPTDAIPRLAAPAIPLSRPSTFLTPLPTPESSSITSIFTLPSAIYILHPQYDFVIVLGAQRLSYFDLFNVLHLEHLIS